jgi:hypothetical protein
MPGRDGPWLQDYSLIEGPTVGQPASERMTWGNRHTARVTVRFLNVSTNNHYKLIRLTRKPRGPRVDPGNGLPHETTGGKDALQWRAEAFAAEARATEAEGKLVSLTENELPILRSANAALKAEVERLREELKSASQEDVVRVGSRLWRCELELDKARAERQPELARVANLNYANGRRVALDEVRQSIAARIAETGPGERVPSAQGTGWERDGSGAWFASCCTPPPEPAAVFDPPLHEVTMRDGTKRATITHADKMRRDADRAAAADPAAKPVCCCDPRQLGHHGICPLAKRAGS